MTPVTEPGDWGPDDSGAALFIADFYPRLGAYLARRHESGYDPVASRARFLLWLAAHADMQQFQERAAQFPRLTAGEETGLAARVAAGRRAEEQLAEGRGTLPGEARADLEEIAVDGTQAGDRLFEANLWLVVSLAERYTGRGVPLNELIRQGSRGLVRAVQKFDATKGYRFATYATWWIRQAITRALADQPGTTPVPADMVDTIGKLARSRDTPAPEPGAGGIDELTGAEQRMLQALGRQPTAEELAAELEP
jgi:RNA polymerase primary sigma factor